MQSTVLPLLPLWAINLVLAGLVYTQAPHKASHRTFTAFVLMSVLWSFCVKMVYIYAPSPAGLLWGRLAFTAGCLMGASFMMFSRTFPERETTDIGVGARLLIVGRVCMIGLTLTPLILRDVSRSATGHLQPHYGPLYPVFGLFVLVAFGYGLWMLARKWWHARGRSRLQMQYLWLGLGIFLLASMTTNLIIPALTGSSRFSEYGPYFTVFLVGLTAHAIIRHRLLDIRLVIRQSVTYCLSLGVTVGMMWGVLIVMERLLDIPVRPSLHLLASMGGVVMFHPVRVRTQLLLDRYCYRAPYDYRLATRTISQVLAGLVRLTPLGTYLTTFIRDTLGVEMVAVYVVHEATRLEHCASQRGSGDCMLPQAVSTPELLALLAYSQEPVVREELGRWRHSHEAQCLSTALVALHSDVLIPLLVEGRVTAVLAVGGKLSGDPFFTHDLEFLSTVGHQASVALRRAQLYEEIAWMKEYNESILRQMVSGVMASDQQGHLTMLNATAARLIGVVAEEVTGKEVTEALPAALSRPLQQTLAGRATYTNEEVTLSLGSGRQLPMALSTSVLHGAEGECAGAILVFHDLSRLKELEEEKRRIERLASIGTLVAGIAHEIKNPLVAIQTLAELLPEQYDDEEFRTTFTHVALHEVRRIDTLVQRLRGLGSSSPLPMRPLSVVLPMDETLALISGELTRRHITLVYEKDPSLPLVVGDHDRLKQVFLNLCLNSLEAMEQEGILSITVGVDRAPGEAPAGLCIQIADTGPGIPAEYFASIFEPFVTSKATGSGLGLAICQGIVEQHRGTIAAANRVDCPGAMFTIRFPIAQGEEVYEVVAPRCGDTHAALAMA